VSCCFNGFSALLSATNRQEVWEKAKAHRADGRNCWVIPNRDGNRSSDAYVGRHETQERSAQHSAKVNEIHTTSATPNNQESMNEAGEISNHSYPNVAAPEDLELPPEAQTIKLVTQKLEEIGHQGVFAVWDSDELSTMAMVVTDFTEAPSLIPEKHIDFFQARTRVKLFVRRFADQERWLELGKALRINPRPPQSLSSHWEVEQALDVLEALVANSFRPRTRFPRCPFRAAWTQTECELIRSLIFVAEHHLDRMSPEQADRFHVISQELALMLRCATDELMLIADAIDADINCGFVNRFTRESDFHLDAKFGYRWGDLWQSVGNSRLVCCVPFLKARGSVQMPVYSRKEFPCPKR
jgi:hypothetical protein